MTHPLQGMTITGVELAEDKKAIRFLIGDGDIVARADGDCCSDTWIEHIELPALGFPAKVVSVEDLEMPEPEQGDYECLASYACKITSTSGDLVIEYRNESNGYYGGDLCWPGDHFYGGVFGQNISEEQWLPVEESI